jgi:hypothetical protein
MDAMRSGACARASPTSRWPADMSFTGQAGKVQDLILSRLRGMVVGLQYSSVPDTGRVESPPRYRNSPGHCYYCYHSPLLTSAGVRFAS